VEVRVQSQDIEKALRFLKKKLQLDGVFGELKKRRFYEKPSVKKKRKQLEAQRRKRKLLKRSPRPGGSSGGSAPRTGSSNPVRPFNRTTTPSETTTTK
jgi:small subunit ribosomal protein S21